MSLYMLFITFTMIYAAKIPPAAVFEDNDSFSAPSDFILDRYDSNESLQKYITREKYSKQLEPSMDSYVAAYKKFHEKYQAAEEKSSDEITRENHNTIDHSVKKRSAPTSPTSPPREMIKFELADAKVPDYMTHELMSTKVPPKVADAVYEAATPASELKASGSRMIKIVHPVPNEFKMTRTGRGVSLDGYTAPVSKASFKLYLSEKHSPLSYKSIYSPISSTRPRYATTVRNLSQGSSLGSGQNLLGPLQTAGLLDYSSGKNWLLGQDLLKSKRLQARPVTQYVPTTAKKPPKYGYTVPPAKGFSSLPPSLSSGGLTLSETPKKPFTPIHEGTTASEGNRFGEPFRSSLADPTFSVNSGSLAALTALIGKSPTVQLQELGQLLKKEKVTRPQESTSPILFHPTTEMPFRSPSTTPVSIEFYPDSQGGRLSFDDITRFYGGAALPTPFTPSDDTKPIVETVTEHPARPTPPQILISPASVTVRTPEDVLRFPQDFHASALVDQPDDDDKHESGYAFGYRVRDYHTGNDYGHTQNRDLDGVTRGQYHILLPDGRVQNVRYTADDDGFHAQISYDSIHAAKK